MKVLLIPSAGLLPPEMQKRMGAIPSSLYPFRKMAILEHIYNKYVNKVDRIFITVYHKAELIKDYISVKNLKIDIIYLDRFGDIGHTIYYSLDKICHITDIDYLYINFGDTLTENIPISTENVINYGTIPYDNSWTFFKYNNGIISQIVDKYSQMDSIDHMGLTNVFVGEFGFKKPNIFMEILEKHTNNNIKEIDTFYQAILIYSRRFPFFFEPEINWVDVGHNATSLKAKIGVEARSFNTIKMDIERGILIKTSGNPKKFIDEIRWYLNIPEKLQYLIPRIYDYSLDEKKPYVAMEYYGYNTLHELYLYGDLPLSSWQLIYERLHFIVSDMMKYRDITCSLEQMTGDMREMYINKTLSRIELLKNDLDFSSFFNNPININNNEYLSLNEYIKLIPLIIEKKLINNYDGIFCVIHGDLCFSNILVEMNYNFIRLVDPRGSFGKPGIYGDARYDLAKILHSLEGGYDYIIDDMIQVQVEGTMIVYQQPIKSDAILKLFKDIFSDYIVDYQSIRLIEALLFLSMLPLHSDSKTRQYLMLATGIKIFDEIVKSMESDML